MKPHTLLACAALLQAALPTAAQAGLIFTMQESGSDVVVTGSGSVDLTGLTLLGSTSSLAFISTHATWGSALSIGPVASEPVYSYGGLVSSDPDFGSSSLWTPASTGSGDKISLIVNELTFLGPALHLPSAYVSGAALAATSTWLGASFASLNLNPGTYTWTWGSGSHADSATLIIGSVSEPGPLALGLAAALAYRAGGRRRPTAS